MWFEERLFFRPNAYPDGEWEPNRLPYEDVRIRTSDNLQLHGWYVPHENPRATILFCHGAAGNISHRVTDIRLVHTFLKCSVLVFDYRGYGRSEGSPTEDGVYRDARAARDWLTRREGLKPADIVLRGRSMGASIAVDLAVDEGARALVLERAFPSLGSLLRTRVPGIWYECGMRMRFDARSKISQYHGPLLQAQGDRDWMATYRNSLKLFRAANEPKEFVRLPGVGHEDPNPPEYYSVLRSFLERLGETRPLTRRRRTSIPMADAAVPVVAPSGVVLTEPR